MRSLFKKLASVDLRALAALRIGLGAVILLDLINRARFLSAHYGDESVVPPSLFAGSVDAWPLSLHLVNGSLPFQSFLFLLAGAAALMLIVGWKTRIAAIISFFLLLSLHGANPYLLHGADMELRVVLFFALFLPLGARWSLDAKEKETTHSSVASLALLLQVGFLYLFAVLHKAGIEWQEGTAAWYALSAEHYGRSFAAPLLQFPEFLSLVSYGIVALQLLALPLLFSPFFTRITRPLAASLLIFMQFAFLLFLKLGFFPLISIAALLPFLPRSFWDFVQKRLP